MYVSLMLQHSSCPTERNGEEYISGGKTTFVFKDLIALCIYIYIYDSIFNRFFM